jgi:trans-2,3-dihydro-3-hydroxyanthranilate isomerase
MEFVQVDVFAAGPYEGNPLAVFPNAPDLSRAQMQRIASEMNLSETTFVTSASSDEYSVRIFTPREELPFAGHPTIGTAWVLRHLGLVGADEITQRSGAGPTTVSIDGERLWFDRTGEVEPDLEDRDHTATMRLGAAVGLEESEVGLEARELGRSGRLRPAYSDAGLRQLMLPIRNLDALERCTPRADLVGREARNGCYCFTSEGAGRVRARGFFPELGIAEDPATGSASAALGLYLAGRVGAIQFEVRQGVEMGRPSRIFIDATPGRVRVGGTCSLVLRGELASLP